jgi:hypothetical protein
MKTHRFVVNVPNPTKQSAAVDLRLATVAKPKLSAIVGKRPKGSMDVVSAGLNLNPCSEEGERRLSLKLRPFSSRDVHVVIRTNGPGIAAFHVIDRRNNRDAGGVMLLCADPAMSEPAGVTVAVARPCPAEIAPGVRVIEAGGDPTKPAPGLDVQAGHAVELVVPITNPSRVPLKNVQIYLEHLGASTMSYVPVVWNAGVLNRHDVFYATWTLNMGWRESGVISATVVVSSQRTNPVRLMAPFSINMRR